MRDLGEVLEFMRLVWAVDHGLQASSKRMRSRHGVTGPQRLFVRLVGKFPGISASEIAAILHLDKSTLSVIARRLEVRGDVVRKADQSDRRRAGLHLTRKGHQIDAIRTGT